MGERAGGSTGLGWWSRGAGMRNFPLAHGSYSWQYWKPGHVLCAGVITRGARPLVHRTRTQDGVRSQLAGHPGALASRSLLQGRGTHATPEQDRVMGTQAGSLVEDLKSLDSHAIVQEELTAPVSGWILEC